MLFKKRAQATFFNLPGMRSQGRFMSFPTDVRNLITEQVRDGLHTSSDRCRAIDEWFATVAEP